MQQHGLSRHLLDMVRPDQDLDLILLVSHEGFEPLFDHIFQLDPLSYHLFRFHVTGADRGQNLLKITEDVSSDTLSQYQIC